MQKDQKISISQLQLNLSRTLKKTTEQQTKMSVTTRGEITHTIVPVSYKDVSHQCQCGTKCSGRLEQQGGDQSYDCHTV